MPTPAAPPSSMARYAWEARNNEAGHHSGSGRGNRDLQLRRRLGHHRSEPRQCRQPPTTGRSSTTPRSSPRPRSTPATPCPLGAPAPTWPSAAPAPKRHCHVGNLHRLGMVPLAQHLGGNSAGGGYRTLYRDAATNSDCAAILDPRRQSRLLHQPATGGGYTNGFVHQRHQPDFPGRGKPLGTSSPSSAASRGARSRAPTT